MLFHITTQAQWNDATRLGRYEAPSLSSEGFIHLSTADQWRGSAARFFRGQRDLVLLELDETKLHDVRFEAADGQRFPHLYGVLPLDAVVSVLVLEVSSTGAAVLLERGQKLGPD